MIFTCPNILYTWVIRDVLQYVPFTTYNSNTRAFLRQAYITENEGLSLMGTILISILRFLLFFSKLYF